MMTTTHPLDHPSALIEALGGEAVRRDEPLARYTSFRVGGPADWLLRVNDSAALVRAVRLAREAGVPVRVLGGGSNVLVSDEGVRGLVVLNKATGYVLEETGGGFTLVADSGVMLPRLAGEIAKRGAAGMEWGVGIPGTVGGAVVQNAGAWGSEVKDRLISAELLWPGEAEPRVAELRELAYRYRGSALLDLPPAERPLVVSATFALERGEPAEIAARNAAYVAERTATQPRQASGGSTFRNPPGDYAGRLIEAAGLKGQRIGNAAFSELHANFIVNHGGATAADIRALIALAMERVRERFGVELHPEVELVEG